MWRKQSTKKKRPFHKDPEDPKYLDLIEWSLNSFLFIDSLKPGLLEYLSGHNVNRNIEDLCNLQDCVDMSSGSSCKMMGRAAFAPTVYKFSCAAGEAGSHVCITEGKDRSFFVYAFCCDELKVSVAVLGDGKVCNRSCVWIELGQV